MGALLRFWRMVVARALEDARRRGEVKGVFFALLIAVISAALVYLLSSKNLLHPNADIMLRLLVENSWVQGIYFLVTGVLAVLLFLFFLAYEPAKIHWEQEKKIENFEERLKSKVYTTEDTEQTFSELLTIQVHNESGATLRECKVILQGLKNLVTGESHKKGEFGSIPSLVGWASRTDGSLIHLAELLTHAGPVSLAVAYRKFEQGRYILASERTIYIEPGEYLAEYYFNGITSTREEKTLRFSVRLMADDKGVRVLQVTNER